MTKAEKVYTSDSKTLDEKAPRIKYKIIKKNIQIQKKTINYIMRL
jgi:hypothetical protein